MLLLNKIRYNVVVKRFIPDFKVTTGQMLKKQLAYLTFVLVTMVIAICVLFIMLFSSILGMILLIVLIIATTVLRAIFNFAIINDLSNGDYTYCSVFTKFHIYVSKYLNIAVILEAKLAIFGFVLSFINGFIKSFAQTIAITVIIINEQFIYAIAILIVAAVISLFLDFLLLTYPTQLSIATYFNKLEPKLNKDGFTKMGERSVSCDQDTRLDEVPSN